VSTGFTSRALSNSSIVTFPCVATIASGGSVVAFAPASFPHWYTEHLRTDFFNGSLTMAGFLFTVATFIVTSVKSGIYDTESYRQRFARLHKLDPKLTLFGPLRQLTNLLVTATCSCLLCATVHVVLGFCERGWATALCVSATAGSATVVLLAMLAARANFMDWLSHDDSRPDLP
jgi:hypothetical protein